LAANRLVETMIGALAPDAPDELKALVHKRENPGGIWQQKQAAQFQMMA